MCYNKEVITSSSSPFQNVKSGRVVPNRVPTLSREVHPTVDRYVSSDEPKCESVEEDVIDDNESICVDIYDKVDSSPVLVPDLPGQVTIDKSSPYVANQLKLNETRGKEIDFDHGCGQISNRYNESSSSNCDPGNCQVPGQVAAGIEVHKQVPEIQKIPFLATSTAHEDDNINPKYYDNNFSSTSYANYDTDAGFPDQIAVFLPRPPPRPLP